MHLAFVPRMVENGGTGASSTGKSLLEALHEAGGGEEAWEAQNKITENHAAYGKDMPWIEVFARNSLGLDFKSMCRDEHGQPAARYDDSGRNPVGGDIVYHYATSPSGTDRLPSDVPEQHCPPAGTHEEKSQRGAQLDPAFPQQESPGEAQGGEKVQLE